jgi:hypothetical protein
MRFAEFRVYVQVDESHDRTLSRLREFIRTCIENLDGVSGVEVEPPRGAMIEERDREAVSGGSVAH